VTELRFYVPLDTKWVILEAFPKSICWLVMEKLDPTQEKHTFTNQKKCTTQNKQKTKSRISCLLRHPAWNRRMPILVLALHKLVTYLLKTLTTCLQPWDPYEADTDRDVCKWILSAAAKQQIKLHVPHTCTNTLLISHSNLASCSFVCKSIFYYSVFSQ